MQIEVTANNDQRKTEEQLSILQEALKVMHNLTENFDSNVNISCIRKAVFKIQSAVTAWHLKLAN